LVPHTLLVLRGAESFVIRADPWNRQTIPWIEFLERVVRRDFSWMVRVRRSAEDPWGAVCHEERVARRSDVRQVVQRIERELHRGSLCRDVDT
jgi:hypothetical protein